MGVPNPVAFKPLAVTFWSTVIYLAILIPLIVVHETVPPPPADPTPYTGINLTKSWIDLTTLSRDYHPFNSRKNDEIHDWLLLELEDIKRHSSLNNSSLVIFDDNVSNISTVDSRASALYGTGHYFEGTNIMVYIRGADDPEGDWWSDGSVYADKVIGKGGVLMNAHYDSVSTGYGATDDGMGVVTLLALVNYFSRSEHKPQRGIVALLNTNEEDYLWGARAFGNSPLMPFCHTFLNLEGAGAGGRANLFRATDAQVVGAYKGSENPFGTVVSSDAWSTGAIRSGTDYQIFNDVYGQRGLDVAFYRPRARYHTNQDDAAHASKASLWHMLSIALHTMQGLSGDTGYTFIGDRDDGDRSKVYNGRRNDGVWFDIYGQTFALFDLRSLFAWSLTLLIAGPLILMALTYILVRCDKYYFFSARTSAYDGAVLDPVMLGGRKGIVRFPFALVVSAALVVGSAYLVTKINPLIIYSSEYTVWAMMISLFYFVFWTIMAGANFARPSALHRGYAIFWLFVISWAVLVANTVFEDRFRIAAGYVFVFLHSATFLASLVALMELFAVPSRKSYAQQVHDEHDTRDHLDTVPHGGHPVSQNDGEEEEEDEEPQSATETTPLVGGGSSQHGGTTFATNYRRSTAAAAHQAATHDSSKGHAYQYEQEWSARLPSWLWILQFLILGPFIIILVGQTGLSIVASVSQTGADGSSLLLPYLLVAFFSITLLLPATPFMHRVTHHIPLFLLVVFVATLIYNLVAFPFSPENRYKVYFQQTVDLDTGASSVKYNGLQEYVEMTVAELPSAMGKKINCSDDHLRANLITCSYDGSGILPNVVKTVPDGVPPEKGFAKWLTYNVTRPKKANKARFEINARETRQCGIVFDTPVSSFKVSGGNAIDNRFGTAPEAGLGRIDLYRRDWDTPWIVEVEWKDPHGEGNGIDGRVFCGWADVNKPGAIPAYDEALKYSPSWVALSKATSSLCEGSKSFKA